MNYFLRVFVGLSLTAGCAAVNPHKNLADENLRTISNFEDFVEDEALDIKFDEIMSSKNAADVASKHVDKLFLMLVKANEEAEKFSKILDHMLAGKRKNPKLDYDPLQTQTYENLIQLWKLSQSYTREITYLYEKCLYGRTEFSKNEELVETIKDVLKKVTANVTSSQDVKRVELQPLMEELNRIHLRYVKKYRKEFDLKDPKDISDISGVQSSAEFAPLIYDKATLSEMDQKTSKVTLKQLQNFNSNYVSLAREIELELKAAPAPAFGPTRQPQNLDVKCIDTSKVCASAGDQGNMTGAHFPKGVWAFTFDDGPTSEYTPLIMDSFKTYTDNLHPQGAKASFFWTAERFDKKAGVPDSVDGMVKRAVGDDYTIGNHSYNHPDLTTVTSAKLGTQIDQSTQLIQRAARKYDPSYKVQFFRCPYGSCYAPATAATKKKRAEIRQMIANQNQIHVYWQIDSLDWKFKNTEKAAIEVIKQMQIKTQGVVLMHETQSTTPDAVKKILAWVKTQNAIGKNFRLVNLEEGTKMLNGLTK